VFGIETVAIRIENPTDIQSGIAAFAAKPNGGLIAAAEGGSIALRFTVLTFLTSIAEQRSMLIAFFAGPSLPICRYKHRQNLNWLSTSEPLKRSGSKYLRRYSSAPTSLSSDPEAPVPARR
jgi:hypothetical protein